MKVLIPGHTYEAANFVNPETSQVIQFVHKEPVEPGSTELKLVSDGTTNEELIAIIIDRLKTLQEKFPCKENACAITHFEEGKMWLEERTRNRVARGVEGKQIK